MTPALEKGDTVSPPSRSVHIGPAPRSRAVVFYSVDEPLDRETLERIGEVFSLFRVPGARLVLGQLAGRVEGLPLEIARAVAGELRGILGAAEECKP